MRENNFNDDDSDGGYESDEEFIFELKRKLNDKAIMRNLVKHKTEIEKMLGCQILISIPDLSSELQEEVFDRINNTGIDRKTNTLKYSYLIEFLSKELRDDIDYNVYIDPIHLTEGLNPLSNIVLVPMDDYIILVPKNTQ